MKFRKSLSVASISSFAVSMAVILNACGISKPDYVKYAPPTATTSTGNEDSAECVAALQAFKDNVSPGISASCISCHNSTTIKGSKLVGSDDVGNRKTIKAYTSTDPATLFGKISSAGHQGGAASAAALPLAKITAWTDAEAKCK